MLQKPIAAEKLFAPNFRPADKLVWDGSKFVVAPAGQLAYMRHPSTGRQMMVVEPTATNLVPYSSNFTDIGTQWSFGGEKLEAPSLIPGGKACDLTPSVPGNGLLKTIGVFTQSQTATLLISKHTEIKSGISRLMLYNQSSGSSVAQVQYYWDDGSVTVGGGADNVTSFGAINFGSAVLLWLSLDGSIVSGDTRRVIFYPDIVSSSLEKVRIHHVQCENTPYWTSPIVTGDTAVTRAGDVLRIDDYDKKVIGADSSGSMFVEYEYPMGGLDSNNYYLFAETVDGLGAARQMIYPVGIATRARAHLYQNGTPSFATANNGGALGVIKAGASFSASELAIALSGVGASDINATGLIAGINQAAISSSVGPATRPIWVSKIWRDHTVRTAAELEALTS